MSEIRIAIPDLDLNNALRLDGNLRNYEIGPFDDVVLDFSRMTNFDPLPMLMAGAIMNMLNHSFALFLVLTLWGVGCLKLKVTQQCTTKNITGLMRILSLITHIIVV